MKLEMTNAFNMGWYIIFNTVTVDPENYSTVFEKGSDVWRKYINKIKRDVGNTTKNGIKTKLYKNYFNYAAVIEEGESTGRLHIHCLLFLKELIPVKDPNYGLHPPRRREIDEYCDYWEYGHCQFIPIRFSNSDPYGKRGWTWPIDEIGQPIPSSSIEKIASYMTKYILKSVDNKGDASWRTKTSRNMGTLKIKTTLTTLNIKMVMALIRYRKAPESIHLSNIQVPFKIIRTLAVKELVHRLRKKRMPLRGSEKSTILKTLLKHGTQTRLDHNSKNIGNSLLQLFKGTATSKTTYKYFMEAKQMLEDAFPSSTYVEPVSGGNIDNR